MREATTIPWDRIVQKLDDGSRLRNTAPGLVSGPSLREFAARLGRMGKRPRCGLVIRISSRGRRNVPIEPDALGGVQRTAAHCAASVGVGQLGRIGPTRVDFDLFVSNDLIRINRLEMTSYASLGTGECDLRYLATAWRRGGGGLNPPTWEGYNILKSLRFNFGTEFAYVNYEPLPGTNRNGHVIPSNHFSRKNVFVDSANHTSTLLTSS